MPVVVYRLLEYTMNHILTEEFGAERANELFRKSGFLAGQEFAKNLLDLTLPLEQFVAQLQKILRDLKIGILRIEEIQDNADQIILTVAQDLDCSGLPPTNEVVCNCLLYTSRDGYFVNGHGSAAGIGSGRCSGFGFSHV